MSNSGIQEVEQPEMNERGIGDNMPPIEYNPMEYEARVISVNALIETAHAMFTGVPVETAEQYETVKALQDKLGLERRTTESQRKIDKQPYIDGGAMVQSSFAALLDKLKLAEGAGKDCVGPYLQKQEQERQEAAKAAQAEREAAEQALQDAHAEKSGGDLEEAENIAVLETEAKTAKKAAGKANKPTATGLKTVKTPTIIDKATAIKHYWSEPSLVDTLMTLIKQDIRAGKESIPGVRIDITREAR